jgi:hypothetical protein
MCWRRERNRATVSEFVAAISLEGEELESNPLVEISKQLAP